MRADHLWLSDALGHPLAKRQRGVIMLRRQRVVRTRLGRQVSSSLSISAGTMRNDASCEFPYVITVNMYRMWCVTSSRGHTRVYVGDAAADCGKDSHTRPLSGFNLAQTGQTGNQRSMVQEIRCSVFRHYVIITAMIIKAGFLLQRWRRIINPMTL